MLAETLAQGPSTGSTLEPRALADYRVLYDGHVDFVWATLLRLGVRFDDAEDLTQEVFVVVFRRLDGFGARASVRTWLYAICLRVASNYRRSQRSQQHTSRSTASFEAVIETESAGADADPEKRAQEREARDLIVAALDRMSPRHRVLFVMFEIVEMSCKDIADELGLPVGTVHSRLHRARESFRAAFDCVRSAQRRRTP